MSYGQKIFLIDRKYQWGRLFDFSIAENYLQSDEIYDYRNPSKTRGLSTGYLSMTIRNIKYTLY